MSTDSFDITKVSVLARIKLNEDEKERIGGQFVQILKHIDKLNELDTSNVEPTSHVLPIQNVFREDKTQDNFPGDSDYLSQAPSHDQGHYEVPKIL
ncbi:MAG: Asp-tRNA(Asn)/Glu-tRNA(Gln) amidotransferase subunit GatC [Nitrospinales bacterium]